MDIASLLSHFIEGVPQGPPQAMTRVTRTPVYWGGITRPNSYGEYNFNTGSIQMNPDKLPQANPDMRDLSAILRHEQVHALVPSNVTDSIMQYFRSNPPRMDAARKWLGDSGAQTSDKAVAQEAPAYATGGYSGEMGQPANATQEYANRMPPNIRQKYLALLGGNQ